MRTEFGFLQLHSAIAKYNSTFGCQSGPVQVARTKKTKATMDCPRGEQSQMPSGEAILDDEFRRILWSIKQYVPFINSNYQLSLYRSWLEKLSLSNSEKLERNVYLLELARQIKNNTVLPPFNQLPPLTNLKDLPKISHFRSSNTQVPNQSQRWPDAEISYNQMSSPVYVEQNYCCQQQQQQPQQHTDIGRNFPFPSPPAQTNAANFSCYDLEHMDNFYYNACYGDDDDDDEAAEEKLKVPPRVRKRRQKSGLVPPVHTQNISIDKKPEDECREASRCTEKPSPEESPSRDVPKNAPPPEAEQENQVKDDSSWCDLTDASITSLAINSLASGDCEKPKSASVQQRVQRFNEFRRLVEESGTQMENPGLECNRYDKSNTNLNCESDALKKVQNLDEAKLSLKDTNFISADWKKTIEGLQLRLTETLQQNNDLKAIISAMQLKMQDDVGKGKEQNLKKLSEQHTKEIEALKQVQVDNVKQLEKSFQVKLDEAERTYHQKVDKVKANYEGKIKELKAEREHAKKEKDKEIARLTEIVQQQCTRMSNEIAALRHQIENSMSSSNEDKISVLQKCVTKMDKLFQKSEREYQKQLEKLKQELELKDKVMQIQLKTQRAELIARTSTEKQRHFDDVVNNLEVKYIKMLEYHEAQVLDSKKQDEEKMEHLQDLLEKNEIPYD